MSTAKKPARKRVRKCNPRSRFPNLKKAIQTNPGIDTVSEGVDYIKDKASEETVGAQKTSVHRSKTLAPLKYLLIAPGESIEAFGDIFPGDDKQWRWIAFDTVGAQFDEGMERTANAAIKIANSALNSFAEPAIKAYVASVLDASGVGSMGLANKDREKLLEHFELQSYTPEGYETPLPGNYADRPVPNMPGYKIRVYAAWANVGVAKYTGKKAYWFQVMDPDGNAIGGSKELRSKKGTLVGFEDELQEEVPAGTKFIPMMFEADDPALELETKPEGWHPATAGIAENPSGPSQNAKKDAADGMMGPFSTSLEANQAADLIAAIFSGERDIHTANPTTRRKMNASARRYFAKKNAAGGAFDPSELGASSDDKPLGTGPLDKSGPRSKLWTSGQKLAKGIFGSEAGDLAVKEGGVEDSELESFDEIVGIPSQDPAATFRMGYYYGILRGINSCSITDYFKRVAFRRQFERKIIQAYNQLAQQAIKKNKAGASAKIRKTL